MLIVGAPPADVWRAMPRLERAWQHKVNQAYGGTGVLLDDVNSLLLGIKNALIDAASFGSPWIVWGSCNGSGLGEFGNEDGVDWWADGGDLVRAAGGFHHSWMVLRQPGLGARAAICVDLNNMSTANATIVLSPSAGFGAANGGADGTDTARPTATDELVLLSAGAWGARSSIGSGTFHVVIDSAGLSTRVLITRASKMAGVWLFETPKRTRPDWTILPIGGVVGSTSEADPGVLSVANFYTAAALHTRPYAGAIDCSLFGLAPAYTALPRVQQQTWVDDYSGEWPWDEIALQCATAGSSFRGLVGALVDAYWAPISRATGNSYPVAGTHEWAQFGDWMLTWNGTAPVVA